MKSYLYHVLFIILMPILAIAQDLPKKSVYFAPTKFNLETEEQSIIDEFLKTIQIQSTEYSILLVGHTDNVGDADYNQNLSQQRCKAVKDYLLTKGLKPSQLAYQSKGYNIPIASNETEDGKAKNRRVELVAMPKNALSSSPIQVPQEKIVFEAEKGMNYTYQRSGTTIQVPANSLVFADGTPVKGEVDMQYREFRDFADFFATDIPMTFDHEHQFESAGMFEINASQNGRKVFVKDGAFVNVEFMMTSDTIPNLNFYEYEHNEWATIGALDRKNQQNIFETKVPCKKRYRATMPAILGDTLQTFMNAMRVGYYMSSESNITQHAKSGFLFMDERFQDKRFIGNTFGYIIKATELSKLDLERLRPINFSYNTDYVQIGKILDKINLTNGLVANFKAVMTEFPEMTEFRKVSWLAMPKGVSTATERAEKLRKLDNNYSDIRVKYLGNYNFEFVLKSYLGTFDTIVMQPIFENVKSKEKEKLCTNLIDKYNRIFNARKTAFDDKMVLCKEYWKHFLAFSKSIMPKSEQCRNLDSWLSYFEKNRAMMESRYYPYTGLEGNIADIKPLVHNAILGNKIKLDSLPSTPRQRLVQGLAIDGFGVFNCDALQRLGTERVDIEAEFVTEAGGEIDPKMISVIYYSLNGILRFDDPSKISFNPNQKVAFIITDYTGEVYVVAADEVKKHEYKNNAKQVYNLTANRISRSSTDAIRDAIAIR